MFWRVLESTILSLSTSPALPDIIWCLPLFIVDAGRGSHDVVVRGIVLIKSSRIHYQRVGWFQRVRIGFAGIGHKGSSRKTLYLSEGGMGKQQRDHSTRCSQWSETNEVHSFLRHVLFIRLTTNVFALLCYGATSSEQELVARLCGVLSHFPTVFLDFPVVKTLWSKSSIFTSSLL
jgi:hypothetical protein